MQLLDSPKYTSAGASLLLILICYSNTIKACSSRSTPKPRVIEPTKRPNITFHTYPCPPMYVSYYCLNGATCFSIKIGEHLLYNCECADGYMGPRCEFKDLDGSYILSRKQVLLETAGIVSGVAVTVLVVIIIIVWVYVNHHRKQRQIHVLPVNSTDGVDGVDGNGKIRKPFYRHSWQKLPMTALPVCKEYEQVEV